MKRLTLALLLAATPLFSQDEPPPARPRRVADGAGSATRDTSVLSMIVLTSVIAVAVGVAAILIESDSTH